MSTELTLKIQGENTIIHHDQKKLGSRQETHAHILADRIHLDWQKGKISSFLSLFVFVLFVASSKDLRKLAFCLIVLSD